MPAASHDLIKKRPKVLSQSKTGKYLGNDSLLCERHIPIYILGAASRDDRMFVVKVYYTRMTCI